MGTPTAPPNWYTDPERVGYERYWDGSQWTEHRRRPTPLAPPALLTPPAQKRRVFMWVILGINALFLAWVISGVLSSPTQNCTGTYAKTCVEATHAGTAIGVALVVIFWAVVDVILGVIWLVTRRREPQQVVYVQSPPG